MAGRAGWRRRATSRLRCRCRAASSPLKTSTVNPFLSQECPELLSRMLYCPGAGSERADTTATSRQGQLAEARHINTSLSVLGRVIIALTRAARSAARCEAAPHVPYRDSRLTFLLEVNLSVAKPAAHIMHAVGGVRRGSTARALPRQPPHLPAGGVRMFAEDGTKHRWN